MYNEVFIDGIIIDCDTIYVGVFVVVGGVVLQVIISRKLNCGDLVVIIWIVHSYKGYCCTTTVTRGNWGGVFNLVRKYEYNFTLKS